jgi:broad specificity phosphatase PhoE
LTVFSLVRHGAYGLIDHRLGGREAHPLNAEGLAQAGRVALALSKRPIAALISSPVRRARETADVLAARLDLPVQTEPDFAEIEFAGWTGASFESLEQQPAWRAWNRFRSTAAVPGGETMLAVQARALAGVRRLAGSWPDGELVVVSHGDIIKAILAHVLGAPLDLLHRIEIAPASTSRIVLHDEDAAVQAINLPA